MGLARELRQSGGALKATPECGRVDTLAEVRELKEFTRLRQKLATSAGGDLTQDAVEVTTWYS